jgi:hypothetical protein
MVASVGMCWGVLFNGCIKGNMWSLVAGEVKISASKISSARKDLKRE